MSKVSVHCFAKLDDAEPAKVFEGQEYIAISDTPRLHRVVINPNHADPTKSLQLHVKEGERNSTDPLRYEKIEVWEAKKRVKQADSEPDYDPATLAWYGDIAGGRKEVQHDGAPVQHAESSNEIV